MQGVIAIQIRQPPDTRQTGAKPCKIRIAIGLHRVQPIHRPAQDDHHQPVFPRSLGKGDGGQQRARGGRAAKGGPGQQEFAALHGLPPLKGG